MHSKKIFSIFIVFIVLLSPFLQLFTYPQVGLAAASSFAGGTGTADDPWIITTPQQLDNVRNDLSAHYQLGNDIDLSSYLSSDGAGYHGGAGWEPIGNDSTSFTGTFDGQRHKIIGLQINRPSSNFIGLFGDVGLGGKVEDIGIEGGSVSGNMHTGGLVGLNDRGSIINAYSSCSVNGDRGTGGLAGSNSGSISNAYTSGSVNGRDGAGGLVGYNFDYSSITDAYAIGRVNGSTNVGGLVGISFHSEIQNSFYDSDTTGQSDTGRGTLKTTVEMKTSSTYTDAGWDFDNKWGINSSVNGGYPFFISHYLVTYNDNGSTAGSVPTDNNAYKEKDTVTVQNNTGNLRKDGYTFDGWNTKSDGSGTTYASGAQLTMGTSNVTLYAKWKINSFLITYNGNGSNEGNITYTTPLSEPGTQFDVAANQFTRTDYRFTGWNTKEDGSGTTYQPGDHYTLGASNVTMYAQWAPIAQYYYVAYNGNGNDGGFVPPQSVITATGDTVTLQGNPGGLSRSGYTFVGWNTKADGNGTTYAAGAQLTMGTANVTLYAQWAPVEHYYELVYDGNGNNTRVTTLTVQGERVTIEENWYDRTGYTFVGWNTKADGSGTTYAAGDQLTMGNANLTLYAQWKINSYTVGFESNGGSAVDDQTVNYGDKVSEPSEPARTGYTFDDWYTDRGLTEAFDFSTLITNNRMLYAKWKLNHYTVHFDSNGGSAIGDQKLNYGDSVVKPADPSQTGYTFAGWYKDKDYTKVWNFDKDTVTQDTTLYARWVVKRYTVSFDSNGGSAAADVGADYENMISAPDAPTKKGYTFVEWYKDKDLTKAWNFDKDTVTEDTTLYAKWTINCYSVTYDENDSDGGSVPAEETYLYNSDVTVSENTGLLSRTGFAFAGWNTKADGSGTFYVAGNRVTMGLSNVTLYAQWKINHYMVGFDSNRGSPVVNQTVDNGAQASRPTAPTRIGYTFAGWYKDKDLTTVWNFDNDIVTQDISLYAKWTVDQNTVHFDSNGGSTQQVDQAPTNQDQVRTGLTAQTVDKTRLQAKFDTIDKEGLKFNDYTVSSWNALQAAQKAAKAVLTDPNVTQAEVDATYAKLTRAYEALVEESKVEQNAPVVYQNAEQSGKEKPDILPITGDGSDFIAMLSGLALFIFAGLIAFITRRRKKNS